MSIITFDKQIILNIVNNISLRRKLYIALVVLITLPLFIAGGVIYVKTIKRLESQSMISMSQIIDQTVSYLDFQTKNIYDTADVITLDRNVQKFLKAQYYTSEEPIISEFESFRSMSSFLNAFERSGNMHNIALYVSSDPFYSDQNTNFFNMTNFIKTQEGKRVLSAGSRNTWLVNQLTSSIDTDTHRVLSAFFKIYDLDNPRHLIGICRVDVANSDIEKILKKTLMTPSSFTVIVNERMEVIGKTGSLPAKTMDILKKELAGINQKTEFRRPLLKYFQTDGKKYVLGLKGIANTDWKLITISPHNDISLVAKQARNEIILFILVITLFAHIFIYFISKTITERLYSLISKMKIAESGNFDEITIQNSSEDEIGQLEKNFNHMLVKISSLMDEKYRLGHKVKHAELTALQAQINPHFLYNTLDMINWMSKNNQTKDIISLVKSLAKFYKLSLSKGENVISIRDEIEHIKTYMYIQNRRFDNAIKFIVNVDEQLLDYSILKLIFQPIVENAIIHGILEKDEEVGTITVEGHFFVNGIRFSLSDNGVGMDANAFNVLLTQEHISPQTGYGIRNIQERIKIHYGNEFGIYYESTLGVGTTVTITIPAIKHISE